MYYRDLHILPTTDMPDPLLMSALMQKLHPYFVKSNGVIGVYFPMMTDKNLGTAIRLQSVDADALHSIPELDFAMFSGVGEVPDGAAPICVKRVQFKSSATRLARRYAKRNGCSFEEAMGRYAGFDEQRTPLPYLALKSASTGQRFRLFVTAEEVDAGVVGRFTSYGLSDAGSTVMRF